MDRIEFSLLRLKDFPMSGSYVNDVILKNNDSFMFSNNITSGINKVTRDYFMTCIFSKKSIIIIIFYKAYIMAVPFFATSSPISCAFVLTIPLFLLAPKGVIYSGIFSKLCLILRIYFFYIIKGYCITQSLSS